MKVVGSKAIIRRLPDQERKRGTIILVEAPKNGPITARGEVIAVNDQYVENGLIRNTPFNVGETVVYFVKSAVHMELDLYAISMDSVIYVEEKAA